MERVVLGGAQLRGFRGGASRLVSGVTVGAAAAATKLVSVVIPCYKEERFIAGCLESVRRFVLPPGVEIEVLVVDGGSTDRTRELVQAAAARDGRIRLLDNPGRIQSCG